DFSPRCAGAMLVKIAMSGCAMRALTAMRPIASSSTACGVSHGIEARFQATPCGRLALKALLQTGPHADSTCAAIATVVVLPELPVTATTLPVIRARA